MSWRLNDRGKKFYNTGLQAGASGAEKLLAPKLMGLQNLDLK
jgi:hypothetical protein